MLCFGLSLHGGQRTPIQRAIAILRRSGIAVYLPGVGVLNGLTAGNFLESTGTTAGAVDQPVGLALSATSAVNASQAVAGNRPILRRGALNLLTYSQDFGNAAWAKTQTSVTGGFADPLGGSNACKVLNNTLAGDHRIQSQHTADASVAYTYATVIKAAGVNSVDIFQNTLSGVSSFSLNLTTGAVSNNGMGVTPSVLPLGDGWFLASYTLTAASSGSKIASYISLGTTAGTGTDGIFLFRSGVFTGTFTAQQIQALGGIPLTTTAPASTALGPYSWDTSGGKSLTATFPAGNESVTVIDARPTGQVTSTAQNVVGAYSINTNTNGRIIVNGALSAPDLLLLQNFANRLAGL